MPGIFACGDVRFSTVKRVASAVGEGSMAIAFVHQYLRQIREIRRSRSRTRFATPISGRTALNRPFTGFAQLSYETRAATAIFRVQPG